MKIILTQDVEKLGNAGTMQEVKPGFARNYLIPKGMAVAATAGMAKQVKEFQAAEQRKIAKQEVAMQSLADRISGLRLTFTARAGETGRLYGSVTNVDIADMLSQQLGEEIDRRKVEIPGGIHEVGEFPVTINLVGRLKPQITAVVVAEGVEEAAGEDAAAEESTAEAATEADSADDDGETETETEQDA
jgi:large subunit ribosomal protein L9